MKSAISQNQFLEIFLRHATFDGWTDKALRATERELQMPDEGTYLLFPNGINDVIQAFIANIDDEMRARLDAKAYAKQKPGARIRSLLIARIAAMKPHKEAIHKLLAHLAVHTISGIQLLAKTSDDLWHEAGDQSVDFNYYTKRTTLSALYAATLLYWLNDESEHSADTLAFLDRRLANLKAFGEWKKSLNLDSFTNPFQRGFPKRPLF